MTSPNSLRRLNPSTARLGFKLLTNRTAKSAWITLIACILPLTPGCIDAKSEPSPSPAETPPATVPGPAGKPLEPGSPLPKLTAKGWLNGSPPEFASPGVRLIVVDIWANWCPFCRFGAPGLVQLFDKYHNKGVAFVSLTNMNRESVQAYVDQSSIPWPNGYRIDGAAMSALGVNSGMPMPGYGIAPTLYLVDKHGKVTWCDRQGRYRHEETADWLKQVDDAIAVALLAPE